MGSSFSIKAVLLRLFLELKHSGDRQLFKDIRQLDTIGTRLRQRADLDNAALTRLSEADELASVQLKRSENEFLASIAKGLSVWSSVEIALVAIAAVISGGRVEMIGIIMYSNLSFSGWISAITDMIARETRCSPIKGDWNNLVKKLRSLKDTRDRLAHNTYMRSDYQSAELNLSPTFLDLRNKSLRHKPLSIREIQVFTVQVMEAFQAATHVLDTIKDIYYPPALRETLLQLQAGLDHLGGDSEDRCPTEPSRPFES